MDKLKNPAAWIGFLCGAGGLAMTPGSPIPASALPWVGLAVGFLGLFGSWFFDAPAGNKPGGGAALALLVALSLPACASQQRVTAYAATIATVQTVDEGIATFTGWAVSEEAKIATDAIVTCKGSPTKAAWATCVEGVVTPRRAPIDKAKTAIRIYRGTVAAAGSLASVDLAGAAAAVLKALSDVGIKVGG